MEAGKDLKEAGYEVRLRIDPIVPHEEWQSGYRELVDHIFNSLEPDMITLWTLRCFPGLKTWAYKNRRGTEIFNYATDKIKFDRRYRLKGRKEVYRIFLRWLVEEKGYDFGKIGVCKETEDIVFNKGICNFTI